MSLTTIPLQAKQTVTGPTTSVGVDISASTYGFSSSFLPDAVIYLRVYGLDAGDVAVFQLESSTNAFSNSVQQMAWTAYGPVGATAASGDTGGSQGLATAFPVNAQTFSVTSVNVQGIPWGTASAVLRINLTKLTGTSPHVTYEAWFAYSNNEAFAI